MVEFPDEYNTSSKNLGCRDGSTLEKVSCEMLDGVLKVFCGEKAAGSVIGLVVEEVGNPRYQGAYAVTASSYTYNTTGIDNIVDQGTVNVSITAGVVTVGSITGTSSVVGEVSNITVNFTTNVLVG